MFSVPVLSILMIVAGVSSDKTMARTSKDKAFILEIGSQKESGGGQDFRLGER